MTNKKQDAARAGLLAGMAAGHEQSKVDRRVVAELDRAKAVGLVDFSAIRPRAQGDTRPARAEHVLELAESIAAVGLLQPLALDAARRLVAGLHRLEAIGLLLAPVKDRAALLAALHGVEHLDPKETARRLAALPEAKDLAEPLKAGRVPCRLLVDLDAEKDPDAALAAEAAENTARRNYTAPEVEALAERLRAAGYRETGGRPRKGEKALRPALELVLGVSASTARRLLGKKDAAPKGGQVAMFSETLQGLARAAKRSNEAAPNFGVSNEAAVKYRKLKKKYPAVFAVLAALDILEAELEDALVQAKALEDGKE